MPEAAFAPCRADDCRESALSFSEFCWNHLVDRPGYLADLNARIRRAAESPQKLNLKKINAAGLDLSNLNLRGSSFSQAHLSACQFVGANLDEADMIGARFDHCDFVGTDMAHANLTRALLEHCSFSHADMRAVYLVEAHIRETDFMGAILYRAVLWNADLAGAKNLRKKNFEGPVSRGGRSKAGLSESNRLVAFEAYRTLKHYFYGKGHYEDGSWAAYRELTMERRHFFETMNPRYLPSLLMDILSGYTEKPNRVIVSSLVIVLTFGLVYYIFNVACAQPALVPGRTGFWDSLYFSFITFTTVGYGDFAPRPVVWFRFLVCLEAFSGPFMAGLYIFTLTRRYAAS